MGKPVLDIQGVLKHPHEIWILKPGTDPAATLAPLCTAVAFADGGTLRPSGAALPPLRLAYPIHKRGQFGCHTFRIPAIARAMDGSLLAVYDMRYLSSTDLQGHMDIGLSRSTDGGRTWADPVPIMDMGEFGGKPQKENGCSDPNTLVDPKTGEILVSAVWTHGKPGTHQWRGNGSEPGHDIHRSPQFMVVRFGDHGKSWSAPDNLTTQLKESSWYLFAPAPQIVPPRHDDSAFRPPRESLRDHAPCPLLPCAVGIGGRTSLPPRSVHVPVRTQEFWQLANTDCAAAIDRQQFASETSRQ